MRSKTIQFEDLIYVFEQQMVEASSFIELNRLFRLWMAIVQKIRALILDISVGDWKLTGGVNYG
ncbi:hypothetical protein BLOT_003124 [Blomia tropicalis]|nr:hypothetical protein BLOT_003124 [Blomia tropicalis]